MNAFFSKIEGFGELYYLKIYGFYEEPLMFSCRNQKGTKYLLLRLSDYQAKWLATEVSDTCLDKLETGRIEMREPFLHPENGYSYIISSVTEPYSVNLISPGNLTDDMLPYAGEYLTDGGEEVYETIGTSDEGQIFSTAKTNVTWKSLLSKTDWDVVLDQCDFLNDIHLISTFSQGNYNRLIDASFALESAGGDAA